jgi:hypothetical protein
VKSTKSAVKNLKSLWKCPKCGERFTGKNMSHSCGKFSLEDLFARSEPDVKKIFREFAPMVRACGIVHMIPQKTRVVFQARMRFAGAMPRKSHLICHFILPRRIDNAGSIGLKRSRRAATRIIFESMMKPTSTAMSRAGSNKPTPSASRSI